MINLIHTKKLNILDQLILEEHLLKNSKDNFCIINEGSTPTIILGICNNENDLVNINNAKKDKIPLIRRFTGGGTVFVDENTLFVTFIFSKETLKIELFPELIIKWAESFYKKALTFKNFKATENDFVINNKKIAGNANYIKKDRFLLHTSFLLDYEIKKINKYLLLPTKTPKYRNNRSHTDFLIPLKNYFIKDDFIQKIKNHLKKRFKIKFFDHSKVTKNKEKSRIQLINANFG